MASPARSVRSPAERARLAGRRLGVAIFGGVFAGATAIWTFQILTTVWGSAPPSPEGCARGTEILEQAVQHARTVYAQSSGNEDERAALERYRRALEPQWLQRKAVEAACQGDEAGRKRLKDVVALRYAEEHAVRYESLGLAPLRRRLMGTPASSSTELKR